MITIHWAACGPVFPEEVYLTMRKDIFLPVLALAGGAVGFLLRLWQYTSAYGPATELFAHGAPASGALVAWVIVVGVLALLLGRGGTVQEKPEEAFLCPSSGYMTVMTAGGMCFLLAAASGVPELLQQYQAWRFDPQYNMLPVAFGLSVLFCLLGSVGALVSGRNNYRSITGLQTRAPATLPAYAALPWLMALYQENSRDPVLIRVFVPLLAAVFLLLALYQQAAFFYRRPHPVRFTFFAVVGITLGLTSLADRPGLFRILSTLSFVLCALGALMALSRNRFAPSRPKRVPDGPRMPQPEPGPTEE